MLKLNQILIFTLFLSVSSILLSNEKQEEYTPPEIGIEHEQFLGGYVPLNTDFVESNGDTLTLKEIIDGKPTVLSLVYFNCPGICSPLLTNLGKTIDLAKLEPGEEYQVISISFDHRETPDLALKWKNNYYESMEHKQLDDEDWRFFVGSKENIKTLTDSVGFYYQQSEDGNYIHSGGLIVLSPKGKISRYLLGIDFLPFDFQMAVGEARRELSNPAVARIVDYCFSYDPDGKTYVFNFNKVFGTLIFLSIGIFLAVLVIKGRKNKNNIKEINNG